MSYQVLARKYRPQRFAEVVGQQGVTQTLRNAIASGRLAQSYIFAGARGVGKTTTARILAKALNCIHGPTPEPCGVCDACVEIAEGRDIDVIEMDAATHTQVETVRETIIAGLAIRPVRDRYKIFIIDEVHQLSSSSFNALLKSIEEPPPHVVFMMATTELQKIPDTIRSRSQEFEFRTIHTKAIAQQLGMIAEREAIDVDPAALALIARAAEGSMRDAESSFDQVIAFAGGRITTADVASVLGLVGRDFLLEIVETVANEEAARVFDLSARAVESGHDLKLVCRELSRLIRDMMVVDIDPSRVSDPDLSAEGSVDRLQALAERFSREDLLRAFDVMTRAEFEVRTSVQPRYHLEMALLKWVHLRKVQPLADVIASLQSGTPAVRASSAMPARVPSAASRPQPALSGGRTPTTSAQAPTGSSGETRTTAAPPAARPAATAPIFPQPAASSASAASTSPAPTSDAAAGVAAPIASPPHGDPVTLRTGTAADPSTSRQSPSQAPRDTSAPTPSLSEIKAAFLEQIRQKRRMLHGTVVAQAARIEVTDTAVVFGFGPQQRALRRQVDENRGVLEQLAEAVAGRKLAIATVEITPGSGSGVGPPQAAPAEDAAAKLRERALADNAVQAMLDVFPAAEIRDVEEIDK